MIRARRRSDNQSVAIKRMAHTDPRDQGNNLREVGLLRLASAAHHPNINRFVEALCFEDTLLLVMECVDGLTLLDFVETNGTCSTPLVATVAYQTLQGLSHLHSINLGKKQIQIIFLEI